MKIVINDWYGDFSVPTSLIEKFGWSKFDESDEIRQNACLIDWVENHYEQDELESYTSLAVVEIPDNATDWEIKEEDGLEKIVAVVDGKIVHI